MELITASFISILNPLTLGLLLIGVIVGIVFGAIPGLTAVTGVSLLLPLTFGVAPETGMALLLGVWVGGVSGGFIAATLLGIPGTPSAIATCFDAYPLSRSGRPFKALGLGIFSSFIGTFLSVIVAGLISPIISRIALSFGPWEYFALGVLALTLVGSLAKGNIIKGLTSALLGLGISSIGMAPIDGAPRFTFGTTPLSGGVNVLALVLGVYAIKQILVEVVFPYQSKEQIKLNKGGMIEVLREMGANTWNIIRSFLIGLWIGFLPGMGSGLSNLVAYSQAKSASKHPEKFGKGSSEGIIASEISNNAAVGGSVIPMLTLGIPGDSVTAILLGGLIIHGIQPGPLLFTSNPDLVYTVFVLMAFAAIITLLLQFFGIRLFPHILRIPSRHLYSVLIIMSFIGAFSSNNYYFDCVVMVACAILALLMDLGGFSMTPLILGFILGPMVELNLRRGLTYSKGNFIIFLTRPMSGVLLVLACLSILLPIIKSSLKKKHATMKD